jgi:hypothetical protein
MRCTPGQGLGQHQSIGRLQVNGIIQLVRELKDAFLDTRVWMATARTNRMKRMLVGVAVCPGCMERAAPA